MVVLVLLQDLEHAGRGSVAELAGRARRGGDAHAIAVDIHPLIGERDDGDNRAGCRAVGVPVELAGGELLGVFIDALGKRRAERQRGGRDRNAAELTTIHSIGVPNQRALPNRRGRLGLSIISAADQTAELTLPTSRVQSPPCRLPSSP